MLAIRKEQLHALSNETFERNLAAQLKKLFPEQCAQLGGAGVIETIRVGIAKAKQYAILREPDLARYVGIMFAFGIDFDTQCDWASAVLLDAPHRDGTMTVERLDAAMMAWLREAAFDSL